MNSNGATLVAMPNLASARARARWGVVRALARNRTALAGLTLLITLVLLAGVGPWISPYRPDAIALTAQHQPMSWAHPLGTDVFGRDVLTRLMYGLRTSLAIAVLVEGLALLVGVAVGLLSAYYGGTLDLLLMRVTDAFLAFPALLFALAIMAVRGPGFGNLVLALLLKEWTGYARLARAEGLKAREIEYVEAARALGASHRTIIVRHMLPSAMSTIVVYATLALSIPILAEATLSFLGLGLPVDTASLGNMINIDHGYMRQAWWAVTFPGIAVAAIVLAFNFIGDGLRDALDPRLHA